LLAENNRPGGKGTWFAVVGLNCAKQGVGKEMIAAIDARKSTEQDGVTPKEN
jgi:hypothetical protein